MFEALARTQVNIVPLLLYALLFVAVGMTVAASPVVAFLLISIIFFVVFFFHTKQAVFIYSAYLAFEETILQHIPATFYLFVKYSGDQILVTLALAVFTKLATRRYDLTLVRHNPINLPMLAFVVVAIFSAAMNEVPPFVAFAGMRQLLRFVVLYYVIIIISSSEWDPKTVQKLVALIITAAVVQATIGYAQVLLGPQSGLNTFLAPGKAFYYEGISVSGGLTWARVKGAFGTMLSRNTYGVFMSGICLMVVGMLHMERKIRQKYMTFLILAVPCIFFSYSRQSVYGFCFGLIAISLISRNNKMLMAVIMGLVLFVMVVKKYNIEPPAVLEQATLVQRMASPLHMSFLKRAATMDRLKVTIEFAPKLVFSKHLLIGLGPASFGSAVGSALHYNEGYRKLGVPPISTYVSDVGFLALLGQFGLVGLIALMSVFVFFIVSILRTYRTTDDTSFKGLALGVSGMVVGFLMSNVGYVNFELRQVSFYLWLLMALTLSYWGKGTAAKLGLAKDEEAQR